VTATEPRHATLGTGVTARHGLEALLAATDDNPFVRWELTADLASTWWQTDGAVGFRRVRPNGRSAFNLLGDDRGVARLVEELPVIAAAVEPHRSAHPVFGVSVPQHLESLLHQRFRVMAGGDWEWFHTTTPPQRLPTDGLVRPLDDAARADEVAAFLAENSPTADTPPGGGERWYAVEESGRLVAVAAWGRTRGGAPHLSSVAVDTARRGQGLGRAIVSAVTRRAVLETGVCTLGMYSDNDVARSLYESLGYRVVCAWASRAVTPLV
jgi:GNAT superfamily N-acetyltransferase